MNSVQSQNALLLHLIRYPRSLCSNILSVPLLLTWWVLSLNNGADGCPKAALWGAWESVFQLLEGDGVWVPTCYCDPQLLWTCGDGPVTGSCEETGSRPFTWAGYYLLFPSPTPCPHFLSSTPFWVCTWGFYEITQQLQAALHGE